jgi:hypothetical protein
VFITVTEEEQKAMSAMGIKLQMDRDEVIMAIIREIVSLRNEVYKSDTEKLLRKISVSDPCLASKVSKILAKN